jgi:hypothetical protein
MHYCGGELEKISYLVKSNSCCGEEEEDTEMNDCCEDENTFARYAPDFTAKKINTGVDFVLPAFDLVYSSIFHTETSCAESSSFLAEFLFPPPKLQQACLVSTSILRI